jgi:WD40 repeat protein
LRRGTDRADINCIAFSPDSKWLAVTSDKATVHVFSVNVDSPSPTLEDGDGPDALQAEAGAAAATTGLPPKPNKRSSLSFLGGNSTALLALLSSDL